MKRYLLFAGAGYNDDGLCGWLHFRGDFDSPDEARAVAIAGIVDMYEPWWMTVDTDTKEIIESNGDNGENWAGEQQRRMRTAFGRSIQGERFRYPTEATAEAVRA